MGREDEAGARLQGVLMLAREFPRHPATRETLLAAREDRSEEVRLRAGMALGDEGRETLVDLVTRAGTGEACAARAITALGESLPDGLAQATLRRANIGFVINPRLVRGLDYYNRTVFEWTTGKLGAQAAVCAGGRYDGLVEQLGGKPAPACGFALGVERLIDLLGALKLLDSGFRRHDDLLGNC